MDADFLCHSRGAGQDAIVQLVIICLWLNRDQGLVARVFARLYIHKHHVVIEAQRRDRRAIDPLQVVHRPAFGIRFIGVKSVVANQVTVHDLQPAPRHLVCHLFQHLRVRRNAFALELVRQDAAGYVGVSSPHDHQITIQPAIAVGLAVGFDRSAEAIIRPGNGQGRGSRKQFSVRRWQKELARILRIDRLARFQIDHIDAPVRAVKRRLAQNGVDFFG